MLDYDLRVTIPQSQCDYNAQTLVNNINNKVAAGVERTSRSSVDNQCNLCGMETDFWVLAKV